MKRVNYHLTVRQAERLRSLSDRQGLSVAELIRRAVDVLLAKDERLPDPIEILTPDEVLAAFAPPAAD